MEKIAVIGAGISGLSISQLLKDKYDIKVFEQQSKIGGLIKCETINGSLYHMVGGHVFNSKRQDVLNWFWSFFDKENEFISAIRNANIALSDDLNVGYPIENHLSAFPKEYVERIISELLAIASSEQTEANNLAEFLIGRFGQTLFELYFEPYNKKIWKQPLESISLKWLDGKLPMPDVKEILINNIVKANESKMVHSSFFYPKNKGSQFLVDRLSEGLNIETSFELNNLTRKAEKWLVNGEQFDKVIFCGNIKSLMPLLSWHNEAYEFSKDVANLASHGTTSVLCEIDKNDYSWIYLPDSKFDAHRIICTGNFSPNNNPSDDILTATIEFTDFKDKEDILEQLNRIPFHPQYIAHKHTQYTYPIQNQNTRDMLSKLKTILAKDEMYLLGRFAEWEYYNMDAAIGAALDLSKSIIKD